MASYRKNLLRCILKTGISTWRTYTGAQKNSALKDYLYPNRVVRVTVEDTNEDRIDNEVDTNVNESNIDNNGETDNTEGTETEGTENEGDEVVTQSENDEPTDKTEEEVIAPEGE